MKETSAQNDEQISTVGYLELLRENTPFRMLWLGQVVSQLGDWFDTIAVYTLVLRLTGSGRAVGLVLVARFLPSVVMGPLSGVVADRFSRRSIMIVSDSVRAVVVLGFLLVRRPDQLWMVYAITVVQLTLSSFFEPAKTAAIPSIVSNRELVSANAISSVTWSIMLTLGAALGGAVTGFFGPNVAFVVDSLTFVGSALFISIVTFPRRPVRLKSRVTIAGALGITDTVEGVRYVVKRPAVLAMLLAKPAWGIGGGILTLLAVFGEKIFTFSGRPAAGIGVLYAARGVGTAVGPLVGRRIAGESHMSMQSAIGIAFLIGGVFYVAFGRSSNFAVALIVLLVAHIGGSIIWVFSTILLQRSVEDRFRGRVFAAEMAMVTLTMAASNYVTGELLDTYRVPPRTVTVGIGILFLIPGVVWLGILRWWHVETQVQNQISENNELGAGSRPEV